METNWNQLIERYLQNELSEEGRQAFEQELATNASLREELELHQLVQAAAKRASQRILVQQVGKSYFRNLRIKQFAIATVVTIATTVGVVYWMQREKTETTKKHTENSLETKQSEQAADRSLTMQSTGQPTLSGDKRSLIHSSDSCVEQAPVDLKHAARAKSGSGINVLKNWNSEARSVSSSDVRAQRVVEENRDDSTSVQRPTTVVLGYTEEKLVGEVKAVQGKGTPEWTRNYDSIGKFNDLYCGYALVMDKAKFGFVDNNGKVFIPLVYDQIIVTTNIKSSKQKNKRSKKKILYIPKRSGKDVKDCDESYLLKMEQF